MAVQVSAYLSSISWEARKRYLEKLTMDEVTFPDPYSIEEGHWSDDVTRWPTMEFGDLYSYLVNTEGSYTQEFLKAYESLEAYNYFFNGYVRTVYYLRTVLYSKSSS